MPGDIRALRQTLRLPIITANGWRQDAEAELAAAALGEVIMTVAVSKPMEKGLV